MATSVWEYGKRFNEPEDIDHQKIYTRPSQIITSNFYLYIIADKIDLVYYFSLCERKTHK